MIKPIYEFLMWENCRNKCSFCFQQEKNQLSDQEKLESMYAVKCFLEYDQRYIKNSHVLLVGGELFDSPSIFSKLKQFLAYIINKQLDQIIDLLYINTNLIYKNIDCLFWFLSEIEKNQLFDRLKFTTSYDIAGRFANDKVRQLMLSNLDLLSQEFPQIKIVVNSMLSRQLCEAILSDEYDLHSFMRRHHCAVNLTPYIIYDQSLAPTRDLVFKALLKVQQQDPEYIDAYVKNFDLLQKKELYQYKNGQLNYVSCPSNPCGHSENFTRYSNQGTCFVCDLKSIFS